MWRARVGTALITIIRYALAAWMMPYGISKLANLQFQVAAWQYTRPVAELSTKLLTWMFLGYQPWFQFLLGVLEFVPAVLLMFRRTWRLGALLLFPVLLNVTLINYALDLWDATKQISAMMLVLNLILLGCCVPMFWGFLRTLLAPAVPVRRRGLRITAYTAEVLIPIVGIGLFSYQFFGYVRQISPFDFIGKRQINRAGSWNVEQMTVAGLDVPAAGTLYFDFSGQCRYESRGQNSAGKYKSDHARRTFELSGLTFDGSAATIAGTYKVEGDRMWLSGQRDGKDVVLALRQAGWGRTLPFGDRFVFP